MLAAMKMNEKCLRNLLEQIDTRLNRVEPPAGPRARCLTIRRCGRRSL